MFGAVNKKGYTKKNSHLVLICDETGIFDTFKEIKGNLAGSNNVFLSLVYVIPSNLLNPLFERELRILEKRFPQNLFIHKLKIEPRGYDIIQGFIEAVIKSNTNSELRFLVKGNAEFIDYVAGVLVYLNIKTSKIEPEII